ncbi:MAG TPA: cation:proton antiporter [Acidimicrobiia bacterium]|jgi:Kef-type K+ transport system membrane component KefB
MVIAQLVHLEAPKGPAFPFLVLFVVIVAGPMIIEKFRFPGIIGLLLGGLLIGPHGLGLVGGGNTTVPDLGQVGLLYLMFVAGLELDLRMVKAHRRATAVYSTMTFLLPMTFGTLAGFAVGFGPSAALLLGSLLASHTLVVYPMIREMGKGDDPAVATGVGATVVTDTLTLIVLAVISGITVGNSGGFEIASQVIVGLIALVAGCFLLLPVFARFFLGRFGTARPSRYVFALVAMLAAASLAEVFGIEGIVGAFFAGLALNRLVPNEGDLMERIEFFGGAVFIPVFLVSVGLIIDPSVMKDPETLRLAAIFIVACFGGKALAALLTRPFLGYRWPEVGVLFSLTIPQAAATLAATIVGFDIGLFSTKVVNAVLVLIVVSLILSALITPVFTRRLAVRETSTGQLGRRVLLVLGGETQLRRGVAELAQRLARSDDGIVLPVVVAGENERTDESSWRQIEAMLVLLGIDRSVGVFIDDSTAIGVRHAARSFDCTAVVIDDPNGAFHDALEDAHVAVPILFVSGLTSGHLAKGRVQSNDGERDSGTLLDLTRRLAGSTATSPDEDHCDLIVQPAGTAEPDVGDRDVTFVRVLSGGD